MNIRQSITIYSFIISSFASCTTTGQITKEAEQFVHDSLFAAPHIGFCIYEPATKKTWYEHESAKYFIPASNTKLFSLYAGLKYLGDSLPAARYRIINNELYIFPTGDPTFLHADFKSQPLFDFLKKYKGFHIVNNGWQSHPWGRGWGWDDYNEDYMAERSLFPVYGNTINVLWKNDSLTFDPPAAFKLLPDPSLYEQDEKYISLQKRKMPASFSVQRMINENTFHILPSEDKFTPVTISLRTDEASVTGLLKDTLRNYLSSNIDFVHLGKITDDPAILIRSRPVDSMFRIMMHRSDNFFAEQTLMMSANEKLHVFDERLMIDSLLKNELRDIPQKPKWVDGSGLSRYNLFTPQSFIYILDKLMNEFSLERIKVILATGGQGTIRSYYQKDSGYIYAKTGTLSNNLAFSGYLFTKKGKLLLFSFMVNNYPGGATPIRRKIESFLTSLRANH